MNNAFLIIIVLFFIIQLFFIKKNFILFLINVLICCSIIAQIPNISEYYSNGCRLIWLVISLFFLIDNKFEIFKIKFLRIYLISIIIISIYVLLCALMSPLHLESKTYKLLFPPLFAYIVGCYLQKKTKDSEIITLTMIYCIYALALVLFVMDSKLGNINTFYDQNVYWYHSKNSISRVIGVGVLMFLFLPVKNKIPLLFTRGVGCAISIIVLMLQSKATILGILCAIIYNLYIEKKFIKLLFLIVFFPLYLFIIFENYNINSMNRVEEFLLRCLNINRIYDIDRFSSGRVNYYKISFDVINEHFWFGIGKCNWPVDNFYLSVMVQLGVFGLIIFTFITLYRVYINLSFSNLLKSNWLVKFLAMVTIMNFVISFLEGSGILGPGNVTLSLWLLSGYFDQRENEFSISN